MGISEENPQSIFPAIVSGAGSATSPEVQKISRKKMKNSIKGEFFRWLNYVFISTFGMAIAVTILTLLVVPLLNHMFHEIPLDLPGKSRALRAAMIVPFAGFVIGTGGWLERWLR